MVGRDSGHSAAGTGRSTAADIGHLVLAAQLADSAAVRWDEDRLADSVEAHEDSQAALEAASAVVASEAAGAASAEVAAADSTAAVVGMAAEVTGKTLR